MIHSYFSQLSIRSLSNSSIKLDILNYLSPTSYEEAPQMSEFIEEAQNICNKGISHCVLTPQIMKGYYDRTEEEIKEQCEIMQREIYKNNLLLKIKPAAEYYLDESFCNKICTFKKLLTLDDLNHHVLIEISVTNEFELLLKCVKKLKNLGYSPVLSQSEKYNYLYDNKNRIDQLTKLGVKFHINLNTLTEKISPQTTKNLFYLFSNNLVSFLGNYSFNYKKIDKNFINFGGFKSKINHKTIINNELLF
jgi:protein-tyrosine phosphatase